MTIKRIDKRFKIVIFVMCLILMAGSIMPMFSDGNYVGAASNEITIYFDTSNIGTKSGCSSSSHDTHDWSTSMTPYYYAYSSSGNTGIKAMTATNKSGSSGGKLFSAKVDKGTYSYIIFLSRSSWKNSGNDYLWQTNNYALSGVADSSIFILSSNGYNDGDKKKQGVSVRGLYSASESYQGKTFSLLNMTSESAVLKYRFTNETKDNGVFNGDGTIVSDTTTVNLGARNYYYNKAVVPDSNDSDNPYSTVEILDSSDNVIKKYFFEEGKILGRTFEYGITQFSDNSVLSFQSVNPASVPAGNSILYLEKTAFTSSGATVKGVGTAEISKSGNANYQTTAVISTSAFSAPTAAGVYDLSDNLFTVEYNGNKYNLFWSETASDNLITINDNVALLSGVYTVQSTNNTLTEGSNTYTYITTQADMFDYQYDHNSSTESYTYSYDNSSKAFYPGHILYTDSLDWGTVCAYFYIGDNPVKTAWPGDYMLYVGRNDQNQRQFVIKVPDGASNAKVIFNNHDNGKQTQSYDVKENVGYYAKSNTDSSGHYAVGTWSLSGTASEQGNAKRPYLTINEALSSSDYAKTKSNYPMYLGQFWLPIMDNDTSHDASNEIYNTNTTSQRAAHNGDGEYYFSDGRSKDDYSKYYGFGEKLANFDWSANLAYRYEKQEPGTYEPYNSVVQNLVYNKLSDDGKLMAKDNTNTIPYFDPDWWSGSFTNSQGDTQEMSDYLVHYNNLDFPFFATNYDKIKFKNYEHNGNLISNTSKQYKGTYYVFNSEKNVVKVNDEGTGLEKHYDVDSTKVWDNYGKGTGTSDTAGSEVGFFPFNGHNDGGHDSKKLHYGFGVKFSIDFYFNDYGTLDGTENGTPITFTFQGDDDVWVFLDDKLALDMGGGHKNSIGEINFADRKVFIGSAGDVGDSIAVSSVKPSRTQTFDQLGLTNEYIKKGKHKITMFYLERGMLNSNLYVMFNLPVTLTKWELNEDTDFGNINQGFAGAAKYVADHDVFNYAVENKNTTSVAENDYSVPTSAGVIRENKENGNTRTTTLASVTSQTGQSNKFIGSASGTYTPLVSSSGGVSYMLTDPFAAENVNYNTRTVNGTNGVISLQYGEIATLSKQFNYGSGMRVTQLDSISSPNGSGSYNDSTGRTASKYYKTYMKSTPVDSPLVRRPYAGVYNGDDLTTEDAGHAETLYQSLTNYSNNSVVNLQADGNTATYNFSDPTNGANEYVFIRQVVINEVRTADLKISKDFLTSETNNTSFDFTINFSNVFGSTDGDSYIDYSNIEYTKYPAEGAASTYNLSSGQFSLSAGDYIIIRGIPVGTKFYITETTTSEIYELAADYSLNMGTASDPVEIDDNVISMVYNNRKTGSFNIMKQVYDESGTALVSSDDTEFEADISFTAPEGVDLTKYDIKVDGDNITFTSGTSFTAKIKHNKNLNVTGLPYGTVYTIVEQTPPMGYVKLTDENVTYVNNQTTIGSEVGNVTVSNKLNPIVMPETGGTPMIFLFPFGIIAISLAGTALMIYKNKLSGESLYEKKEGEE